MSKKSFRTLKFELPTVHDLYFPLEQAENDSKLLDFEKMLRQSQTLWVEFTFRSYLIGRQGLSSQFRSIQGLKNGDGDVSAQLVLNL